MTDSRKVYQAICKTLNKFFKPETDKRHNNKVNVLARFISGIIQSKQVKLASVASDIPNKAAE